MAIKLKELKDKFEEKGRLDEFHMFVIKPDMFLCDPFSILSIEAQKRNYYANVESAYASQWEYWSVWIDHQQHKFTDNEIYNFIWGVDF